MGTPRNVQRWENPEEGMTWQSLHDPSWRLWAAHLRYVIFCQQKVQVESQLASNHGDLMGCVNKWYQFIPMFEEEKYEEG